MKAYILFFCWITTTASTPVGFLQNDGFGKGIIDKFQDNTPFLTPDFGSPGRERAFQGTESKLSRADNAYSNALNFVGNLQNAKPLVDTIQEHEKYGNDASAYKGKAAKIVNGYERISIIGSALLEAPQRKTNQISRTLTAALNQVGATLVGL